MDTITNRDRNLLEYGGGFGALLSLTCLVQHIIVVIPMPLTNAMMLAYIFCIIAFLFMAFRQLAVIPLLIISAVISILLQVVWLRYASFSLVVMILFIYHVVMLVLLFTERIPAKLKADQERKRSEEDFWRNKV